ncbi:tripartite tricarboxylate transporter substrate binding protein [Piscinibacter gummiphilus]|jgi:tripartite-type tricarboxylate transporter receptor subunit TctC|uniref:Tripartite tricarboxylate transporter substrate binding protein n=3 Tax=Burkholderiales TaxID=80840 RepID=A0ABZ0D2A4_9BURK|nr:tripartite tricarboxylate transporter substrate binding protein [Piscinibacter gummiphilus]WOB11377.1 tripartite tricarboxylate transporter substrate binding protein [Piscinibacter gummiphilus]
MSRLIKSHMSRRQILSMTAITIVLPTWAQSGYPSKPITILVPFPAGGTTDILGRLVGRHLASRLGGTVVVENKPGAGGSVGSAMVAKAAGDGYTLLLGTIGTHSINQYLYKKLAYDPFKDFAPISLIAMVPNVLVVNSSSQIKTVKDLIAAAKADPGKLTYASAGNGTSIHLCGAMFEQMAQVSMSHVPYRGSAPAITDLIGGQTTCMFDNLPSAMPHIKSGALRAVAVTTAKRSAALPEVPTIAESGVAGYDASSWFGMWAPASVPASLVGRLNEEIRQILVQAEVRQTLKEQGAEAAPDSPAQFAAYIQAEANKWSKVVQTANVQLD